ncbi:hypothetical protein MHB48_15665 [Psychrobacillus sp. FSL H8-0483]|uniref:hypothetical protein n=1 Tax=Psychrobacillus sp. FSL H8-0483 TaxID=2921389 RepID=UPI00315A081F
MREQIDEEAQAQTIISRLTLAQKNPAANFYWLIRNWAKDSLQRHQLEVKERCDLRNT